MYILNNYEPDNKSISIETNKETKEITLINLKKHIIQIGKEFRPYCNYFIIKPSNNSNRIIDNLSCKLIKSKSFLFQTYLLEENHKNLEKIESINKLELGIIYGTDKVRKRIKNNKEMIKLNINNSKSSFSNDNNLLPKYNEKYKSPTKIYSIDLLFSKEFLEEMKEMNQHINLNSIPDLDIERLEYKIANYFCHILSKNEVKVHRLPKSFEYLEHMKYTEKSRDCVFIRFIVLLLILLNGRISLNKLPTFRIKTQKVKIIMNMLGCVKVGDEWILKTGPKEYKRRK